MKKIIQKILFLMLVVIFSAGCTSQTDNLTNSENSIPPTTAVRDLHNVKFHLVDQNNTPIDNALITANYNSSAYPPESNAPNNNRGYTDEYGNLSFVMRASIQYDLTVSNLHDKQEIITTITPTAVEYSLQIKPTVAPTPVPTRTNSWDNLRENNFGYQFSKGICSFIPIINDALNC